MNNNMNNEEIMDQSSQAIAEEMFVDESSQDAVINANVATLERDLDASEDQQTTTPPNQSAPTSPAAPKKSKKAKGARGKQPVKKQKLNFEDEESDSEDTGTTSLGKLK